MVSWVRNIFQVQGLSFSRMLTFECSEKAKRISDIHSVSVLLTRAHLTAYTPPPPPRFPPSPSRFPSPRGRLHPSTISVEPFPRGGLLPLLYDSGRLIDSSTPPSMHPSIHQHTNPSINTNKQQHPQISFLRPFIRPPIYPSTHPFIPPPIHPPMYQCIHKASVRPKRAIVYHPCIHPCFHPCMHPSSRQSFRQPIHPRIPSLAGHTGHGMSYHLRHGMAHGMRHYRAHDMPAGEVMVSLAPTVSHTNHLHDVS